MKVLEPGMVPAFEQALVLAAQGRLAEAASQYEAVLVSRPQLAQAQFELGVVLGRFGRDTEALARFAAAVRLQPDLMDAHFNHGIALAKTGRYTEAVDEFKATLKLQPAHPFAAKALEQASHSAARAPGR